MAWPWLPRDHREGPSYRSTTQWFRLLGTCDSSRTDPPPTCPAPRLECGRSAGEPWKFYPDRGFGNSLWKSAEGLESTCRVPSSVRATRQAGEEPVPSWVLRDLRGKMSRKNILFFAEQGRLRPRVSGNAPDRQWQRSPSARPGFHTLMHSPVPKAS